MVANIRAVGMVIYTYAVLEERLDALWAWVKRVERWSGVTFSSYDFTARNKPTHGHGQATPGNRKRLYRRLQTQQPWFTWGYLWPTEELIRVSHGIHLAITSRPQPERNGERFRSPSYIFLEAHVDILKSEVERMRDFVALGAQAWDIAGGSYGFIDVETGTPLRDRVLRNAIHLFDSTVQPEFHNEFREWQMLMPVLNRRVWKAFWGNFLGAEHLQSLGGVKDLQRADPQRQMLPEYQEQAYRTGLQKLNACGCFHQLEPLAGGGVMGCLSESPLDWFEPEVQARVERLQNTLGTLTLEL